MKKFLSTFLFIFLFNTPAFADIVWPSLYIASGMTSIKVIISGLIAELLFVKYFTKISWLKASIVTLLMNLITTLLGVLLIPLTGLLIEILVPGPTFHFSHWILSYCVIITINTVIEGLMLEIALDLKFKQIFGWLFAANVISVLMCIIFYGVTLSGIKL